jgi:hypothetical protein
VFSGPTGWFASGAANLEDSNKPEVPVPLTPDGKPIEQP